MFNILFGKITANPRVWLVAEKSVRTFPPKTKDSKIAVNSD
jgi:hypothetical protein